MDFEQVIAVVSATLQPKCDRPLNDLELMSTLALDSLSPSPQFIR